MNGRQMLVAFEELIRNTNPDLELDIQINTDVAFNMLTRGEEEYIVDNFLVGDSVADNVNAIRKRSDVLRNIIKRSACTISATPGKDGGYTTSISNSDYWMFLSGILGHTLLPTNDKGFDGGLGVPRVELDLINHYDLQKKVRTTNNEPVFKYVPIVLEGSNSFVLYLDMEKFDSIGPTINASEVEIIYLAHPPGISLTQDSSLAVSTHNDIVKKAVSIFIAEYKYKLGIPTTKENG